VLRKVKTLTKLSTLRLQLLCEAMKEEVRGLITIAVNAAASAVPLCK
jgi:hypothetical protein